MLLLWPALALLVGFVSAGIHEAIDRDDLDAVKDALEGGEDINVKSKNNQSPVMHAALDGKFNIAEYLLTKKPDLTLTDGATKKEGYTPIHGAAFKGKAKIVKLLIENGMDANELHADGFTPLHRACWGSTAGHAATVEVFLKAGVSASAKSQDGDSPLGMATLAKNKGSVSLIKKYLVSEGVPASHMDRMVRMSESIKEANDPKKMQEMLSNPAFMGIIQGLAGKFGNDKAGFEEVLEGVAGQANGDQNKFMDLLKGLMGGGGSATHTEL